MRRHCGIPEIRQMLTRAGVGSRRGDDATFRNIAMLFRIKYPGLSYEDILGMFTMWNEVLGEDMGFEILASVAWGIDLGPRNEFTGELGCFAKSEDCAFEDWATRGIDSIFIDEEARRCDLAALYAATRPPRELSPEERGVFHQGLAEISGKYASPIVVKSYGENFSSHMIVLARSIASSRGARAGEVQARVIGTPSSSEMVYLKCAMGALGIEFKPEDVRLLVAPLAYC